MKITAISQANGQLKTSPLLDYARQEKLSDEKRAEQQKLLPTWVVDEGSELKVLWQPRKFAQTSENRGPLLLVEETQPSHIELTLELWQQVDRISALEKGYVLNFLKNKKKSTTSQLKQLASQSLQIPPAEQWIETYLAFPQLPSELQKQLQDEQISINLFYQLNDLPEELFTLLTQALAEQRLRLTVQEARQLSTAVRRLPRDELPEIIGLARSCLESKDDLKKQTEKLLNGINKRAYPELTNYRENFSKKLEELDLDGRINVKPPQNFEGDYLDFSFRWSKEEDFEKLLRAIKKCRRLFDLV